MGDNLALFSRFYYRPSRAASDALDNGSIAFAIALAVLVLVLRTFAVRIGSTVKLVLVDPAEAEARFSGPQMLADAAFTLLDSSSMFPWIALFIGMTPVSIAAVAAWDGLGSASVVLRREYVSMLVCGLFAWAAVYLPVSLLQIAAPVPFLFVAAHIAFLALFVISLRTALGTSTGHAAIATIGGWVAALAMVALAPFLGGFSYFLLSPWVLYMLFRYYSPDVRSLGESMNSRRSFRRQLEASMINPRDADAHFQLGLIYEQRRQFDDAVASFRRAIAIEPGDADTQLHLGRSLRASGKPAEALPHMQAALAADPRVSRQEGWRDLGATLLDLGQAKEACEPLARYTEAREYDPEGLFYYGAALRTLGRTAEARTAFEQAVAAFATAPKYRRGQLRRWNSQAKAELKSLKS